jgi:hypothetical protein
VNICHESRAPLMHYLCIIEKFQAQREQERQSGTAAEVERSGPLAAIYSKVVV